MSLRLITRLATASVKAKIKLAQKQKQLAKGELSRVVSDALAKNIISKDEAQLLEKAEQARLLAISVDDFGAEEL